MPHQLLLASLWSDLVGKVVLISLLLCLGQFMLSRFGDWHTLAQQYPALTRPVGDTFYAYGGRCGTVYVNGSMRLIVSPIGLYVMVWTYWGRPFHPPLLLPWSGVQSAEWRQGWFTKKTVLVFRDGKATLEIYLSAKIRDSFRAAAGDYTALQVG